MADLFSQLLDPTVLLTGASAAIIAAIGVVVVVFKDRIQNMIRFGLLKKYPIKCFIFELRANMPIPVSRLGAVRLPVEDGAFDVLRLENNDKIRVFGFKNLYSWGNDAIMFLLKVGKYEYHVMDIELHEKVPVYNYNDKGDLQFDKLVINVLDEKGNPILDEKGKPLTRVELKPQIKEVQSILFRPRVDEDIMAWVIREMRRAEERRRNKTLLGQALYLAGPLILAIALMVLLKGTLDPLVQLATVLGPDIRELAAALRNVAIVAVGPKPPI